MINFSPGLSQATLTHAGIRVQYSKSTSSLTMNPSSSALVWRIGIPHGRTKGSVLFIHDRMLQPDPAISRKKELSRSQGKYHL